MSMRNMIVSVVTLSVCMPAMASFIDLQLAGVNLSYSDADGGGAGSGIMFNAGAPSDPLNGIDFLVDGSLFGSLGFADDLDLDFSVTGIPNIAVPAPNSSTSVSALGGGSLELFVGGSSIIAIDLLSVEVIYTQVVVGPNFFQIQFTGAIGTISSQSLPFGLLIGDPIHVSFSQQGTPTSSGGFLTGFIGSGTGEISGELIPAPGALALLGIAALAGKRRRRT